MAIHEPGESALATLRQAAKAAVDRNRIAAIARAVDMTPDGLRHLLDGGVPGSGSRPIASRDAAAQPRAPGGELTAVEARRVLWSLVSDLPVKRQLAGVRKMMRALLALYGEELPEWLLGLQGPAPGAKSREFPVAADACGNEQERAEDHSAGLGTFHDFVRGELEGAGVAPEAAKQGMAEVFRRYTEGGRFARDPDVVRARLFRIARQLAAERAPDDEPDQGRSLS